MKSGRVLSAIRDGLMASKSGFTRSVLAAFLLTHLFMTPAIASGIADAELQGTGAGSKIITSADRSVNLNDSSEAFFNQEIITEIWLDIPE